MISAIIVAAGKGKRMGEKINKQYIKLRGKEVLAHTLCAFAAIDEIEQIVVVTGEDEVEYCISNIIGKLDLKKEIKVVCGGSERQQSVYNGLINCSPETDIVLIHDGARPFVSSNVIRESIQCATKYDACTVAVPVKDTVKRVDDGKNIINTLNRDELYMIQTPQTFRYSLILEAHNRVMQCGRNASDDTLLVEEMGINVKVVHGDYFNIKLTTPDDLVFGNAILDFMEK